MKRDASAAAKAGSGEGSGRPLQLFGGKKGLIVNSKNLCRSKQRARVKLVAHNGRVRELRPLVGNGCGGKKRGKGRRTR